jgi:hypothetical protein
MASPTFITEPEWEQLSDSAFNSPDCATPEATASFRAEYWAAHDAVRTAAQLYVESARARGAESEREDFFTMNDDFGDSRFIDLECHSAALITLPFAEHLQSVVRVLPQRYLVALHHDLNYFDDRFDGLFDAFIDSDRIRVFSECAYATKQFQIA